MQTTYLFKYKYLTYLTLCPQPKVAQTTKYCRHYKSITGGFKMQMQH